MTDIPQFATEQEARAWLDAQVDDDYVDNERFAYKDDQAAMEAYVRQAADGCCGDADYDVIVAGRPATIGCNFGH